MALTIEGHGAVPCVWWDGAGAPTSGQTVVLVGVVREFRGTKELHVHRTMPSAGAGAIEGGLLRYWTDCIEAEAVSRLVLPASGSNHLLIDTGAEPAITALSSSRRALPSDNKIHEWCARRQMGGRTAETYAGWPLITAVRSIDRGAHSQRVVAPLFFAPVDLERASDETWTVSPTAPAEINTHALTLLGLSRGGAEELSDTLSELPGLDTSDAAAGVALRLAFLLDNGILNGDFDPEDLGSAPSPHAVGATNTAILFDAPDAVFTRNLLRDLAELSTKPLAQLRSGPVGALLGAVPVPPPPPPTPQPCVLPTSLAQDRAISSALANVLTVVTGPPGTGKSQMLVNLTHAAIAQGQTVLFASKNNNAVDVVFERIAAVSDAATPVRAGKASYRSEVADTILAGISRGSQAERAGDDAARAAWDHVSRRMEVAYERAGEIVAAQQACRAAEQRAERARSLVPPELAELVMDVDAEHIAASYGAARRATDAIGQRRWFWRRRQRRQAQQSIDEALTELLRWAPLDSRLAHAPAPDVLSAFGSLAQAVEARESALEARRRVELLPKTVELDDALLAHGDQRLSAARDLVDRNWERHLQGPASTAAKAYAQALAAADERQGRGASALADRVPAVLGAIPAWGVTNLAARTFLPLHHGLFDLVIIDEASQCDLPSALPLLWRARRAVIVGDPDQLTHITALSGAHDRGIADRHGLTPELHSRFSYLTHSPYSAAEAAAGGEVVFLDRHYRSHPDIIGFSNEHVYGNRLHVVTDPTRFIDGPAVEWRDIAGSFSRGSRGSSAYNPAEAAAVADGVTDLHHRYGAAHTLGVVTPFRAQVELLRQLIAQRLPDGCGEILVDTAHAFQGDERDIIVFSPVVSPQMPQATTGWAGERHLINVALTRARCRLIIVGDHTACLNSSGLLRSLAVWTESRGFVLARNGP